ncbi:hypothetical protein [Trinickia mobilis]|uniref:hypothetical protein n=1 Tax=Trinickia mobilis TaxID=2816356 RepID=UPI001A8C5DC8|nr:hypothetical protein [Trinickia mobilis]
MRGRVLQFLACVLVGAAGTGVQYVLPPARSFPTLGVLALTGRANTNSTFPSATARRPASPDLLT